MTISRACWRPSNKLCRTETLLVSATTPAAPHRRLRGIFLMSRPPLLTRRGLCWPEASLLHQRSQVWVTISTEPERPAPLVQGSATPSGTAIYHIDFFRTSYRNSASPSFVLPLICFEAVARSGINIASVPRWNVEFQCRREVTCQSNQKA